MLIDWKEDVKLEAEGGGGGTGGFAAIGGAADESRFCTSS